MKPSPGEVTPFKILHISDVHFGSHFDVSVWEYICELAKRECPDLIACTGDVVDHGGLFMLALAKKELEKLRLSTKKTTHLRCVPGNHDCGPFGLLKLPLLGNHFASIFGDDPLGIPDCVPSYLQYRDFSFPRRCLSRVLWTTSLYLLKGASVVWRFLAREKWWSLPLLRKDDPDGVMLVYLDSNHALRLASGNVDAREVTKLKAKLLNIRDESGSRPFVPRIALMHHHPLPIPEASIDEGLTSFEPFLVLRNAGLLMRELNRCDVDLILHGHKHYSSFGRLGYAVDHTREGEIAVLAAGSAGVTHSELGRNSVNLIDVFETGRMSYTSVMFGAGGGSQVNEVARAKREVHGLEMHKARVHRRAAERQGQWVEKLSHTVVIDMSGTARVWRDFQGHVFERSFSSDMLPIAVDVSMGRVANSTLQLIEKSVRAGHSLSGAPNTPTKKVRCNIKLGSRLVDGPPVDYGYQYLCFNTFAISQWEANAAYDRDIRHAGRSTRNKDLEFAGVVIRVPTRVLVFQLGLPVFDEPTDPFVHVFRWSTYPNAALDTAGHFDCDESGEWVRDADLTVHEAGKLVQIKNHLWELRIDYPLVGHRYDIRWRVGAGTIDKEASNLEVLRRGRAVALRERLLEVKNDADLMGWLDNWASVLHRWFLFPNFSSIPESKSDLEITVFAYNASNSALESVYCYSPAAQDKEWPTLSVPLGEGVVGAAFKRSSFILYVDPKLSADKFDAAYLYQEGPDEEWVEPAWRFVAAFPIFALDKSVASSDRFELGGWGPQTTVGVVTVSSKSPSSRLLHLLGPDLLSTDNKAKSHRKPDAPDEDETTQETLPVEEVWFATHVVLDSLLDDGTQEEQVAEDTHKDMESQNPL